MLYFSKHFAIVKITRDPHAMTAYVMQSKGLTKYSYFLCKHIANQNPSDTTVSDMRYSLFRFTNLKFHIIAVSVQKIKTIATFSPFISK